MLRKSLFILLVPLLLPLLAAAQGKAPKKPAPVTLPPLGVLSIIPAQGEPGTTVTLNGTGFTAGTGVFLGSRQLPATLVGNRLLTTELPDLPPGVYALYLKREDGSTSRAFNFSLQAQRPVALSLSPDTVTACSTGREREVVVTGSKFQPGARVFMDGAALTTRFVSPAALSFTAPAVAAGLHQVQVKNPSDAASGALALFIDAKPEITNVSIGREFVSAYELILTGKNFQQSSVLVADGKRVATGEQLATERERLIYLGCNQMIYERHPYDPTPKEIRLQVVNPNGEESSLFTISAP
jgi:hypothetical protein